MLERENQFKQRRFRLRFTVLILLLTLSIIGCSPDKSDTKKLIGVWMSDVGMPNESLTFFADGTFSRERKAETEPGTGIFRTVMAAKGKWEEKNGTLHLVADQAWASGEFRWEIKESSLNLKELSLQSAAAAQPVIYRSFVK